MSGAGGLLQVADSEWVARFIVCSGWFRKSDQTVKQDAFIPPRNLELSVTRHVGLSSDELWQIGQAVANERPATLYGRADILAISVKQQNLNILPTPTPKNHANIVGWPSEKHAKKAVAQELAAAAKFVSR
jgi:hypothetical protein